MIALPSCRPGDGRDRDRLPVDHLRRLFHDAAGHSAWLSAAHEHHSHRRPGDRPNLRPLVNWTLAAATLAAVIGFGSSDALAGAFGIAVSLLMAITTLMATFVALHWKCNPILVYAVNGNLLAHRPSNGATARATRRGSLRKLRCTC